LDVYRNTQPAQKVIRSRTRQSGNTGIILGSGLSEFTKRLGNITIIPFVDMPGFARTVVPGHMQRLVVGEFSGNVIFALDGRLHLYEGHSVEEVVFPVRVLKSMGVSKLIITCASGCISEKLNAGDILFIDDHINLTGANPLTGLIKQAGTNVFVDMRDAYERDMFKRLSNYTGSKGIMLKRGVLCAVHGPSYETPAEINMLRAIGADAVCMSTVPEVIMAKYLGMKVAGLSLITNTVSGIKRKHLTHGDVVRTAKEYGKRFADLLEGAVSLFHEK